MFVTAWLPASPATATQEFPLMFKLDRVPGSASSTEGCEARVALLGIQNGFPETPEP